MEECIFCQIASHKIPAEIVYEDDQVIAFKDIKPSAKIHLLIVPKIHFASNNEVKIGFEPLLGRLFGIAKDLAKKQAIDQSGYKLVVNVGPDGGQIVNHFHVHLLGGEKLKLTP